MGIISVEQSDRLYWLGRYSERVYTTVRLYFECFDTMIDFNENTYDDFCKKLDIPNVYPSPEDFKKNYAFSETDENSIYMNLNRAYGNAIELRETIGTASLSYIQLAVYEMNKAKISESPLIDLQKVVDDILAFWGVIDDRIEDEKCRNTIKIGKRIERIDLYARLHFPKKDMLREVHRLQGRIGRCTLNYNENVLNDLENLVKEENLDYYKMIQKVESILE